MASRSRSAAAAGGAPHDRSELLGALGVDIDAELLECALTHRSYAYENGNLPHNERLEFLGDSVLSVVITDALYRTFPDLAEGRLAKMRASVVNMRALAGVARGIGPAGLGAYLRLGRGEETTGGRQKASILADALEAVLGAVYLSAGIDESRRVVHQLFDPVLARSAKQGAALDWKTSLQELTASMSLGVPEYFIVSAGPDHMRTFTAQAVVAGERFGARDGRNKKEAEQAAAATAWQALRERAGAGPADGTDGAQIDGAQIDGAQIDGAYGDAAHSGPGLTTPVPTTSVPITSIPTAPAPTTSVIDGDAVPPAVTPAPGSE